MFERFTERARQVVVLAQETARTHQSDGIYPMHLLMGVLLEGEGLGARVLKNLNATEQLFEGWIPAGGGEAQFDRFKQLPFTPDARKGLEYALREALSLGHSYIGTEHILLALLRIDELYDPVTTLGGAEVIRNETLKLLSKPQQARPDTASEPEPEPQNPLHAAAEHAIAAAGFLLTYLDNKLDEIKQQEDQKFSAWFYPSKKGQE